jgi:hypothetical protein
MARLVRAPSGSSAQSTAARSVSAFGVPSRRSPRLSDRKVEPVVLLEVRVERVPVGVKADGEGL